MPRLELVFVVDADQQTDARDLQEQMAAGLRRAVRERAFMDSRGQQNWPVVVERFLRPA